MGQFMGYQDFISECEAANFTGVSTQTLKRFAEAGYLQVEIDSDGMRLFSRPELEEVFGISAAAGIEDEVLRESEEPSVALESEHRPAAEILTASSSPDGESGEMQFTETISAVHTLSRGPISGPVLLSAEAATAHQPASAVEIIKLKHVIELQEKLLDARDKELLDLRTQRDWLKERIERLEAKAERDQLLLLSETQVIRKLVTYQERKKSTIRTALEWLGFVDPSPAPPGNTIEMAQPRKDDQAA